MKNRHAHVRGEQISFRFRGKSGKTHHVDLESPRLARIVKRCQDLPGQELFQYEDEKGKLHRVDSADVNDYLRKLSGREITAKDFRTWAGTTLAAKALEEFKECGSQARAKRNITRAIEAVAARLGNTVAVCRKCYVHPDIIDSYLDRTLVKALRQRTKLRRAALKPGEAAVLALLKAHRKNEPSRSPRPTARRKAK